MNTINSWVINNTVIFWDLALDNISFNSYWLQNEHIITQWEWFWLRDYPARRINITDIPQWDWQILNDTFFGWRTISISWVLHTDTSAELDTLIDEFKLKLSFANKLLKHKVNDEIRQINATCNNISFWTKEKIYITFDLTFISQDAFWTKTNQDNYLIENMSDNSRIEDITNELKEAFPFFIFWLKSWSITELDVKSNWIWINITETINNWDVLYINWKEKEVLLNWTAIDYDWVFPLFENWSNNVEFTITWTYTADVSIIWANNLM